MPTPSATATPKSTRWPRLAVGGSILLLSAAALIWTVLVFTAEYRFRLLSAQTPPASDIQSLSDYKFKLERLIAMDPTNGEILSGYVTVLGRLNDYSAALTALEKARKTFNAQDSLFFIADMLEKKGETAKAEAAMAECLVINPAHQEFNPARLWLLNKRLIEMTQARKRKEPVDEKAYQEARRAYGEAALNWAIRAPHDMNAYLFLGQFYVEPLYALQSYRCYLIGLSGAPWLTLSKKFMILPQNVLGTVSQILNGHYAKQYRNLP